MSGLMSIGGLASGLQTDEILAKLEQLARVPISRLQTKIDKLSAQKQAWAATNTRLLAIKEKAAALKDLGSKVGQIASSSDSSVLTAIAGPTAAPGDYSFRVDSLSTTHQMTSQHGVADAAATLVGSGNLKLSIGEKSATIALDGLTLNGLRDKINAADAGAKAVIVSDGTTSRLLLNSQSQGTTGRISLVGSDADALNALQMAESQAAKDTVLTFGSGAGAFQVTRVGMSFTDVIPGLTLNLKAGSEGKSVFVSVVTSNNNVKQAVKEFVDQYNAFQDFVGQQTLYDEKTGATGTLFGEYRLTQIVDELASTLTNPISTLPSEMRTVLQAGLTTTDEGRLVLDESKFDDLLKSDPQKVFNLFGNNGLATDSAVTFLSATDDTRVSSGAGYAIAVTQPATKTTLTLGTALPGALVGAETIAINGANVELQAGWTPQQIVDAINAKPATGVTASLVDNAGQQYLKLTRNIYGSAGRISIVSSLAAGAGTTGIGMAPLTEANPGVGGTGVVGLDIVGTINGEAATGAGQELTSTAGSAKGLKVKVEATGGVQNYGTVSFSRGVGSLIDNALRFITNDTDGSISRVQEMLQKMMDDTDESMQSIDASVTRQMTRMRNQFDAMEVAMSKLQTQSNQLASQIAAMSGNKDK